MSRSLFLLLLLAGCAKDEAELFNRLTQDVGIEIRAPRATLRGGCSAPFSQRFCEEEYEVIGVLDVAAGAEQVLTISDDVNSEQCTNILWLRLVFLDEVGPVDDRGTLFQLPALIEIEQGAGALHTVAYPQATVRIDEVGESDLNQARPPPTCAELGRDSR